MGTFVSQRRVEPSNRMRLRASMTRHFMKPTTANHATHITTSPMTGRAMMMGMKSSLISAKSVTFLRSKSFSAWRSGPKTAQLTALPRR